MNAESSEVWRTPTRKTTESHLFQVLTHPDLVDLLESTHTHLDYTEIPKQHYSSLAYLLATLTNHFLEEHKIVTWEEWGADDALDSVFEIVCSGSSWHWKIFSALVGENVSDNKGVFFAPLRFSAEVREGAGMSYRIFFAQGDVNEGLFANPYTNDMRVRNEIVGNARAVDGWIYTFYGHYVCSTPD